MLYLYCVCTIESFLHVLLWNSSSLYCYCFYPKVKIFDKQIWEVAEWKTGFYLQMEFLDRVLSVCLLHVYTNTDTNVCRHRQICSPCSQSYFWRRAALLCQIQLYTAGPPIQMAHERFRNLQSPQRPKRNRGKSAIGSQAHRFTELISHQAAVNQFASRGQRGGCYQLTPIKPAFVDKPRLI